MDILHLYYMIVSQDHLKASAKSKQHHIIFLDSWEQTLRPDPLWESTLTLQVVCLFTFF